MSATLKLPKIDKVPEEHTLAHACYNGNVQLTEEYLENDPGMVLEADENGATPLHYSLSRSSLRTAQLLVEQPLLDEYKKYKDKLTELAKRAQNMGKSMVSEEDLRLCAQWLNEERARYSSEFQIQCYRATFDLLTMPDNSDMTPLHFVAASRDNTLSNLLEYSVKFSESQVMYQGGSNKAFGAGGGESGEESVASRLQRAELAHAKRGMKRISLKQVNVQDKYGNTPLHYAAASGSNGTLRCLLSLGADKKITNKEAQTPAEVATDRFCRMALMQMPEAADVAIDKLSTLKIGETKLKTGKKQKGKGNREDNGDSGSESDEDEKIILSNKKLKSKATHSIQALIDCGNDVNEITSIQANTALHRAAARAQSDVAESLLKAGADVTKTNCNGWTPLHCCAYFSTRDHCDVASILISADADVNARTMRKRTALHMAVLQQHVDTSTKEFKVKPRSNKQNGGDNYDTTETENMLATDSSKWLRQGWGIYDENTRTSNRSPKRKIRQSKTISTSVVNMVNLLIQNGCDLEAKDIDGMTALHHAAKYGNPRTVFTLIEAGANMYAVCKRKFSALHYASANGKNEVVRLLVKLDCEDRKLKNMRNCSHQTPFDVAMSKKTRGSMMNLWEACEEGQLERVRVYLNNVPSIRKTENTGEDALHALKPWMPVTVTETTRKNKRSCLDLV